MKKVLMIGMSHSVGGIETYIINVLRQLAKDYQFYFPYIENVCYEQEIRELGGQFITGLPRSRRNPIAYYKSWNSVFKEYHFDIVYFNNCDIVNLDVLKMAKKHQVPVRIFHAHSSSAQADIGFIHSVEERANRKQVETIITDALACSENAGNYIFEQRPYCVIQNGIDTERFSFDAATRAKKRAELGLDESQKVILFVGRFAEVKNPLFALDVMKECHKIDSAFAGLVCGAGELADAVEKKVQQENLSAYVQLLGNRTDLNEIYSAADYLIMPSLFEGFPFVLVEAQCGGLKCICSTNVEQNTNLIGTAEYFSLEEGSQAWAKKIMAMPIDCESRYGCKEKITQSGFDIVETAQQVREIFEGKH